MAVKPFSPSEALNARKLQVPDAAVEALNGYLATNYTPNVELKVNTSAMHALLQKASAGLSDRLCRTTVETLNDNGWHVRYVVAEMHEEFEPYYSIKVLP